MEHSNIIKLLNNAVAPEVMQRSVSIILYFGSDEDRESIEVEGNLTMAEICFLKERFSMWIREQLREMEDDV